MLSRIGTRTGAAALAAALSAALGLSLALGLSSGAAASDEPIPITWIDLTPPPTDEELAEAERAAAAMAEMLGGFLSPPTSGNFEEGPGPGMVYHGTALGLVGDGTKLVDTFDDKRVSMPGYMFPIEATEDGVTRFLLVPFIGACLHVPPPPPNQIVLIDVETPYPAKTMFEAVTVIGAFSRSLQELDEAGVGYHIAAEQVVKYQE